MTDIAPDERTDFKGQMSIFWDGFPVRPLTADELALLKAGDISRRKE